MTVNFPELTSFGTLMKFAIALEEVTADLTRMAAEGQSGSAVAEALQRAATKHAKRHEQLEQMRRERLNEVVLQPIHGLDREAFLPPTSLPTTSLADIVETVAAAEDVSAKFYDEAASVASNVLSGLDKTFRRLAKENRALAESLRSGS